MLDVYVFQGIVTLLLFLYSIKPAVKSFQSVPGITLLPLLACVITVLAFLTSGYQPQMAPLALFAIWQTLGSVPALSRQASHLKTDDWRDVPRLRILLRIAVLITTVIIAFRFAPQEPPPFTGFSQAPWRLDAPIGMSTGPGTDQHTVPIALYPPPKTKGGKEDVLILIVPPALGSGPSVDRMAREFAARGFWTLTFGCPGVDFPATLSDNRRVWPSAGHTLTQAFAGISHPSSTRARRQRTDSTGPKTSLLTALHTWLAEQSQSAWPAIENGPAAFRPSRMAIIGIGDGASAATALAQEEGQAWTREDDVPPLPVTALLLTEPLFANPPAGTPVKQEKTGPVALWQKFTQWLGFERKADTSPTQLPIHPFSAPIPLLITVASTMNTPHDVPWRYHAVRSFIDDHRASAALLSIKDSRPSAFSELSCRTPLAAFALDRNFPSCRSGIDSDTARPDTITRNVDLQSSFLELALYGVPASGDPWESHIRHVNKYWQYPISTGILERK